MLGYTRGDVADYQMAAWCMAVYFKGLSGRETHSLTDAMIRSGETLDLSAGARAARRRQALDGRRGRQDVARGRADRGRLRCPVREDVRPRARTHGRHARQARVDPGLPGRADDRRVRAAGARGRARDHRPDRRPRAGRQEALRAPRRDRDCGHRSADRLVDHVEEARSGRRRDRPRREGRRRRVHEDARRRPHSRRADGRSRPPKGAAGRLPAHRHGSATRVRLSETRSRCARRSRRSQATARPTSRSSCSTPARACSRSPIWVRRRAEGRRRAEAGGGGRLGDRRVRALDPRARRRSGSRRTRTPRRSSARCPLRMRASSCASARSLSATRRSS